VVLDVKSSARSGEGASEPDVQQSITAFWNTIADGYEDHPGNVATYGSSEHDEWAEVLSRALPAEPSDVLDVATGTGFIALLAAGLGHRVTGIDLSVKMLAVARRTAAQRRVSVAFEEGDAVTPPFPPETFDVVTNRHLLWTLREPQLAMRSWRRLLRPGGRLVIFDGFPFAGMNLDEPSDDAEDFFLRHYSRETLMALPFFTATDTTPVVEMLQNAGFRRIDAHDLPQFTFEGITPYVAIAL
jgi:ubiquinone/menaquinone biosynthesis C-methylase UbiE